MRTSSFIPLAATMAALLPACDERPPEPGVAEIVDEITVKDCEKISAAFSEPATCPKPAAMTNDEKKAKCGAVKTVALNDYKKQFGKDPDCSEGWVFGPGPLLDSCIKDSGKNLCKLAATNPKPPDTGWPASNNWSLCLNDWVIYCTDNYPAEMGIKTDPKGVVCFHKDLDYSKLPVTAVTAREVCQRLTGDPKAFPPKCPDDLCKPKKKPGTKMKNSTCVSAARSNALVEATPFPCDETWECAACDPETDSNCEYDLACGCEICDPSDTSSACSEDLDCPLPMPTPTPEPTPEATPYPTPGPTPYPTPGPTPGPTPSATPVATPMPF